MQFAPANVEQGNVEIPSIAAQRFDHQLADHGDSIPREFVVLKIQLDELVFAVNTQAKFWVDTHAQVSERPPRPFRLEPFDFFTAQKFLIRLHEQGIRGSFVGISNTSYESIEKSFVTILLVVFNYSLPQFAIVVMGWLVFSFVLFLDSFNLCQLGSSGLNGEVNEFCKRDFGHSFSLSLNENRFYGFSVSRSSRCTSSYSLPSA